MFVHTLHIIYLKVCKSGKDDSWVLATETAQNLDRDDSGGCDGSSDGDGVNVGRRESGA